MSSSQIVNITSYSPETDMFYAKPKINSVGGKNVAILNNRVKKTTMLSTPLMLTWGLSEFVDEKSGKRTYDLSLQFPNADYPDADGEAFLEKMKTFEAKIKEDAVNNSKEWFNKPKMSAEVVDALWTPMLKYPKNKDTQEFDYSRSPSLRVKVPYWDGEWKVELYNTEQRQIWPSDEASSPMELVPKLTRIACVIQCGGIWFANGKFGVTWKLFQAVVKPPQSLKGKCHIIVADSEKETTSSSGRNADVDSDDDAVGVTVQDSDDEGDAPAVQQHQEVAQVETVSSQPDADEVKAEGSSKKKVVRRKKADE